MAPKRKSIEAESTPNKRQSISVKSTKKDAPSKTPKKTPASIDTSPIVISAAASVAVATKVGELISTSPLPAVTPGRGRPRKSLSVKPTEIPVSPEPAVVPLPKMLIPATYSEATTSQVKPVGTVDPPEMDEAISIWNQCWSALFNSMMTIGPLFLAITLMSYAASKISSSQAIASIGVIYAYLYIVIMGSYVVAILPFILMSRVFTSLVSSSASPEPAVVPLPKMPTHATYSEATTSQVKPVGTVDPPEMDEAISIWNQCWSALFNSMMTIGPLFLAITLMSYAASKISSSQAIASVGVIYAYLYIVILGSYVVALLPFILISRVFTSLVSSPGSMAAEDKSKALFHIRLLILMSLGLGLAVYQYGFI
jgi:hypothetical protein